MGAVTKKPLINRNLISLKCVLFIFFGGLGCIFPFLPMHMLAVGLNYDEARIITIVTPLVSIIGPLIVGPLADKLAGKKSSVSGKYLRIIAALCITFAAVFYCLLLVIPEVTRVESRRPTVSFACDSDGAVIFQERCREAGSCHHFKKEKYGSLVLQNCTYTCQKPSQFENLYVPWSAYQQSSLPPTESPADTEYDGDYESTDELQDEYNDDRQKREVGGDGLIGPPHVCQESEDKTKPKICHAYTVNLKFMRLHATLRSGTNQENDTHSEDWCRYPLDGFQCNVPEAQKIWMRTYKNNSKCIPKVECEVHNPYAERSVLADSQCIMTEGDPEVTFWSYLLIRSLADIFPVAAITTLDAAIIIATRETSMGRGDVGHQLAWGSLGWAIFAPIAGAIQLPPEAPAYLVPIAGGCALMLLAAIVLVFATGMPLTPPEWWWHTQCGMVAIPMSAVRKYAPEATILAIVTLILGIFWSAIESYQPWHILALADLDYPESNLVVGLTVLAGALPAIPVLWYAEHIADYCGHSNLLIASFAVYILRYTGLAILDAPWWTLTMEVLEPVTLGLTWVTIVMYFRHIIPRRLTATGQAIPVIAHYCLGKSLGAVIGLHENGSTLESLRCIYRAMAIAACVVAIIYFILYYLVLAPRCAAPPQPLPENTVLSSNGNQPNGNQPSNGNNYTPLKIYHTSRGRKGHFRY